MTLCWPLAVVISGIRKNRISSFCVISYGTGCQESPPSGIAVVDLHIVWFPVGAKHTRDRPLRPATLFKDQYRVYHSRFERVCHRRPP